MSLVALHPVAISWSPREVIARHLCGRIGLAAVISRNGWLPALLCFLFLTAQSALAQAPQISPAGAVSAASYAQPISPGSIVSIFGTNLAAAQATASSIPLPTSLAGASVTVDGIKAPLFYVSPGQINLQAPSSMRFNYAGYTPASVVVTTAAGSSPPVPVPAYVSSPSMFTLDSSGCGRAAALNIAADGSFSLNSPSNSAAPGDYVAIFGTGFDLPQSQLQPPDGSPVSSPVRLESGGGAALDGNPLGLLPYFGLAPNLVGVDQVNLQIPSATRNGCAVPVTVLGQALVSPTATISVSSTRGQCTDPPIQSYGRISLIKTIASGTGNDGEADEFTAVFPSGPALQRLQQPTSPSGGETFSRPSRFCPVPGYAQLSAGPIRLQTPNGSPVVVQPDVQNGSTTYSQSLPAGFIAPGQYTISALGGVDIGPFQAVIAVGSPIQVQKPVLPKEPACFLEFGCGELQQGVPFTIRWTGGDQTSVVRVSLVSVNGLWRQYISADANASARSVAFQPICSGQPPPAGNGFSCFFNLPSVDEVVVEVVPAASDGATVTAKGVTGPVQVF